MLDDRGLDNCPVLVVIVEQKKSQSMQVIDSINDGCKSCQGFLIVWFGSGQDRDPPEVRLLLFFLQRDQLGSIRTWNYRLMIGDTEL
jgi:hypothetical protein